jgi:cell division initiation protein
MEERMKIAPIDIAHKTFARKVMGADLDEVMDFLRDIADQMEELIRERNTLKESIRQKDLQIMEYKERDESLKMTIQTAAKMSDGIRTDAEREAKLIISDAQQKADMIIKDGRDSLKRVYQEIADLKRMRIQFEANIRSLCQAHIGFLEQSHLTMPDPQINLAHAAASMNGGMPPQGHSQAQHSGANGSFGASGSPNMGGVANATVTHVNMPTPGYNSNNNGRPAGPVGKA